VNFAISHRGAQPGAEHLGIQLENRTELEQVYAQIKGADGPMIEIEDPQGAPWETFLTTGGSTGYGSDEIRGKSKKLAASACCAPSCSSSIGSRQGQSSG
jgi:hypothetical protein